MSAEQSVRQSVRPRDDEAVAYRGRVLTAVNGGERVDDPGAPAALRFEDDGALVVDARGRIAALGPFRDEIGGGPPGRAPRVVDLRPALIVPGFVDAHVHFPQTRIVGSATGELLEWLEKSVFPEEARFRDEAYAREVAGEFCEALARAGTTTASIFSSSSAVATRVLFEALDAWGLRGQAGLTLMDRNCPDGVRVGADRALAESRALADAWDGHDEGRLRFVVTPRFAISCTSGLLEGAARLARDRELPVQTHVSENVGEGRATLELFPDAADYVDVYERHDLLGARTILAHAIHLSPREWGRLEATKTALAHCADSNFFLGSGRMRLREAMRRGVRVGMGTDVAAGRTFSIRRACSSAYDNALIVGEPVAPAELFTVATLGGARALGLEARIGTLEPGKDADFAVFDLPASANTEERALAHLLFATDDVAAKLAFVRGRALSPRR